MRALLALLAKELQQHTLAVLAGAGLVLAVALARIGVVLESAGPSLVQAAGDTVLVALPAFALFLGERLVAQERSSGTHAFLDALPMPPSLRFMVPWALGALATSAVTAVVVALTAAIAAHREGIPEPWLLQVFLQTQLYALASFGVAFALTHLGSLRILCWWLFFVLVAGLAGQGLDPTRTVLWTRTLMQPLDAARAHPDHVGVGIAALWLAASFLVGIGIATWRGGAWPRALFRPVSSRGFGLQVLVAILAPLTFEVGFSMRPPESAAVWDAVPRVPVAGVDLRVAGRDPALWAVGRAAAEDLAELRRRTGIGPLRPVVLLPGPALDLRWVRPAPATEEAGGLVLMVDTHHRPVDLVRDVVHRILVHQTGERGAWSPHLGWLLRGAPAWLRPDPMLATRASQAHAALEVLPDWLEVELAVGEDLGEAVAWTAFLALGDEAVVTLLRAALDPPIERYDLATELQRGPIGPGWVAEVAGVDLTARWREALEARLAGSPDGFPITIEETADGQLQVVASGPVPPEAQVRWRYVDALSTHPLPSNRVRLVQTATGDAPVVIPADREQRVAAELVWFDPYLLGYRTTGWGARW